MTDYQRKVIKNMRIKGAGYKAIAGAVGISRDSVRSFCRRNGLDGTSELIEKNVDAKILLGEICLYCAEKITQPETGRKKKFCSEECRRAWWSKNTDKRNPTSKAVYKIFCLGCGKEFISYGNKNRKYCSHGCYISARFKEGEML